MSPGSDKPDWFALEKNPQAARVKVGDGRAVYRLSLPSGAVYAKVFDPPSRRLIAAALVRLHHTRGEREWRRAIEARKRGIAVVAPIAVGVDRSDGRSVLVTTSLDRAVSFAEAWDAERFRGHALIRAVANLLADAHEKGFIHRDGHPSNILVRESGGGLEAVFVDLAGCRFFDDSAPRKAAVRSLAQFDQWLHRKGTLDQRRELAQEYLTRRPGLSIRLTDFMEQVERARISMAESLARRRDRRILGNGKYFVTLRFDDGWRATVVLQLERRHLFPEPGVPDRTAEQWRELLRGLPSLGLPASGAGLSVDRRTASAARREFVQCHRRRHRDVPADLLLGFCEHRTSLGRVDQAVVLRPAGKEDHARSN